MITLFLFALSIAVFLFLLILLKRKKYNADYILAGWMCLLSVHLVLFVLDVSRISYAYPFLLGVMLPIPVLHGVLLYWYTLQTTTNTPISRSRMILHLAPFVLLVILAVPFYLLPSEEKVTVFVNRGRGYEWYSFIQYLLITSLGLGYSVASIVEIRKHRARIVDAFSNDDEKKLVWLEWLSLGLGGIWLLSLFFPDEVIFTAVLLAILFIGVFGINQAPVFFNAYEIEPGDSWPGNVGASDDEPFAANKYLKTGLTNETVALENSLREVMEKTKPYRNRDLTLDELAAILDVNPQELAQVINSRIGKTFYHYVNGYRIREFVALSASSDSKRLTFPGLALDCGFKSKTTFHKYFKIETGRTPSDYFKTLK
jgi:AraC-like DNA-binding protein